MELNRLHPRALKFWRIQALLSVILAVLPATVAMGFLLGKALSASLGVALVVLVSSLAIWMAFWVPKLAYDDLAMSFENTISMWSAGFFSSGERDTSLSGFNM